MAAPTIDIPPLVQPLLREYLKIVMQPLSTANAEVMPAYIFAILKRKNPIEEIRGFAMEQMRTFLESKTEMFVARLFELLKYRFDAENMARGLHTLLEYHKNNPNTDPAGKFLNGSYKQIAGWPDTVSEIDGGSSGFGRPSPAPIPLHASSERLGPSQRSSYRSRSKSRSRSPKRNRDRSPDRRGARRDRDDDRDDYSSSKRRRHDDSYGDSRDYSSSSGRDRDRSRDSRDRERDGDKYRDRERDRDREYRDRDRDRERDRPGRDRPRRDEPRFDASNMYPASSSTDYAVPTTASVPVGMTSPDSYAAAAAFYYGGMAGQPQQPQQQPPLDGQGDPFQQNDGGRFGRDGSGDRNYDNGRGGRGGRGRGRGGRGGRGGAGRGSFDGNNGGDDGHQNRKERDPTGTTLDLGSVPEELNNVDSIWKHFSKFGQIKNIITEPQASRAHVKFNAPEEATAAIRSPDAVMGNRFVRIYWGSQDIGPAQPGSDVMNRYAIKILGKEATQFVAPEIKEKEKEIAQQKEELRAKLQARLKDQKELLQRLEKLSKNEELAQEVRDTARKDLKTVLEAMNATIQTMKGLTSAPPPAPAPPKYGAGRGRGRGMVADYGDASHLEQRLAELHKERVTRGIPMPRGRGRGGRGGGPGRFNLDLRPTTFKITSLPGDWNDEGRLRTFFESYGSVRYINIAGDEVVVQMDNRKNAETAIAAASALGGGSRNWTDNPDPSVVEQLEMEQHQQDLLAIDAAHSAAQSGADSSDGIEVATNSSKDEIEVEPYYEEEAGEAM